MQPPTGRSRRVALWRLVGHIVAKMFMQVFIERAQRLAHSSASCPLILSGVDVF
jgi:hypothetical protein